MPTITRNHSSIYLKYKNEDILIDCGEGTQRQIRKAKINPCKITQLLITHLHSDHVLGIPGLFQTLNLNGYKKILKIYGPKGTENFIKNIFKTFVTIKIKTEVHEIEKGKVLETKDLIISALPLNHGTPTLGFSIQEKDRLRINKIKLKNLNLSKPEFPKISELLKKKNIKINNKIIKYKELTYLEKGRKISIILDTKLCPNIKILAKDSDIAIIESTFLNQNEMTDRFYKHLTAEQAAKTAKQANVKKLYLTHLSQRYEHKQNLILAQAKKFFPETEVARDFMALEI